MVAHLQHAADQPVVVDHRLALAHAVDFARVDHDHMDEGSARIRNHAGGDELRSLIGHDLKHPAEHLVLVAQLLRHCLPLAELGVVVLKAFVALVDGQDAVKLVEPVGDGRPPGARRS